MAVDRKLERRVNLALLLWHDYNLTLLLLVQRPLTLSVDVLVKHVQGCIRCSFTDLSLPLASWYDITRG